MNTCSICLEPIENGSHTKFHSSYESNFNQIDSKKIISSVDSRSLPQILSQIILSSAPNTTIFPTPQHFENTIIQNISFYHPCVNISFQALNKKIVSTFLKQLQFHTKHFNHVERYRYDSCLICDEENCASTVKSTFFSTIVPVFQLIHSIYWGHHLLFDILSYSYQKHRKKQFDILSYSYQNRLQRQHALLCNQEQLANNIDNLETPSTITIDQFSSCKRSPFPYFQSSSQPCTKLPHFSQFNIFHDPFIITQQLLPLIHFSVHNLTHNYDTNLLTNPLSSPSASTIFQAYPSASPERPSTPAFTSSRLPLTSDTTTPIAILTSDTFNHIDMIPIIPQDISPARCLCCSTTFTCFSDLFIHFHQSIGNPVTFSTMHISQLSETQQAQSTQEDQDRAKENAHSIPCSKFNTFVKLLYLQWNIPLQVFSMIDKKEILSQQSTTISSCFTIPPLQSYYFSLFFMIISHIYQVQILASNGPIPSSNNNQYPTSSSISSSQIHPFLSLLSSPTLHSQFSSPNHTQLSLILHAIFNFGISFLFNSEYLLFFRCFLPFLFPSITPTASLTPTTLSSLYINHIHPLQSCLFSTQHYPFLTMIIDDDSTNSNSFQINPNSIHISSNEPSPTSMSSSASPALTSQFTTTCELDLFQYLHLLTIEEYTKSMSFFEQLSSERATQNEARFPFTASASTDMPTSPIEHSTYFQSSKGQSIPIQQNTIYFHPSFSKPTSTLFSQFLTPILDLQSLLLNIPVVSMFYQYHASSMQKVTAVQLATRPSPSVLTSSTNQTCFSNEHTFEIFSCINSPITYLQSILQQTLHHLFATIQALIIPSFIFFFSHFSINITPHPLTPNSFTTPPAHSHPSHNLTTIPSYITSIPSSERHLAFHSIFHWQIPSTKTLPLLHPSFPPPLFPSSSPSDLVCKETSPAYLPISSSLTPTLTIMPPTTTPAPADEDVPPSLPTPFLYYFSSDQVTFATTGYYDASIIHNIHTTLFTAPPSPHISTIPSLLDIVKTNDSHLTSNYSFNVFYAALHSTLSLSNLLPPFFPHSTSPLILEGITSLTPFLDNKTQLYPSSISSQLNNPYYSFYPAQFYQQIHSSTFSPRHSPSISLLSPITLFEHITNQDNTSTRSGNDPLNDGDSELEELSKMDSLVSNPPPSAASISNKVSSTHILEQQHSQEFSGIYDTINFSKFNPDTLHIGSYNSCSEINDDHDTQHSRGGALWNILKQYIHPTSPTDDSISILSPIINNTCINHDLDENNIDGSHPIIPPDGNTLSSPLLHDQTIDPNNNCNRVDSIAKNLISFEVENTHIFLDYQENIQTSLQAPNTPSYYKSTNNNFHPDCTEAGDSSEDEYGYNQMFNLVSIQPNNHMADNADLGFHQLHPDTTKNNDNNCDVGNAGGVDGVNCVIAQQLNPIHPEYDHFDVFSEDHNEAHSFNNFNHDALINRDPLLHNDQYQDQYQSVPSNQHLDNHYHPSHPLSHEYRAHQESQCDSFFNTDGFQPDGDDYNEMME